MFLQIGAAPLVDRLVRIADDAEVAVLLGQPLDQQVLRAVRVLVLVDHDEPELARVEVPRRFRRLEQLHRLEQEIVEVERVAVLQRRQILLIDLGDLLVAQVPLAAQRVGPFHAVLRLADARQRRARRHELVVDAELALGLLHDCDLIGRVVDDEVARQANLRRLAPEQPRAQRMERREPHAAGLVANERLDALAHLLRRLVGERDGEHLIGLRMPVADEVRDAVGDDPSLPRARTSQDEQRPVAMQHRFALFRIQFVEEVHFRKNLSISFAGSRVRGFAVSASGKVPR